MLKNLNKQLSKLMLCSSFCLIAPSVSAANGQLSLVSVGIGDPDNITIKAQKTIQEADIVFGMSRVQEQFPDLLADKTLYEAGHGLFTPMQHRNRSKTEVEAMEKKARTVIREAIVAGKNVAIIDYGDPLVYGPQTGYLHEFRDLDPQVIPGVSSFNAANAALATGITSGKNSHSVILTAAMSAHPDYQGSDSLAKLAAARSSLVFFTMGMDLSAVVSQLQEHYPLETPMAIVRHAGYAERQEVTKTTLGTILQDTNNGEDLPFEHLIYIGDFLQ